MTPDEYDEAEWACPRCNRTLVGGWEPCCDPRPSFVGAVSCFLRGLYYRAVVLATKYHVPR